eukprot:25697-Eustigmatos_ZCMA.PRE.1
MRLCRDCTCARRTSYVRRQTELYAMTFWKREGLILKQREDQAFPPAGSCAFSSPRSRICA